MLKSLLTENTDLATEERYDTLLRRSEDAKLRRQREERDRAYRERAKEFTENDESVKKEPEYSSSFFKTITNWDDVVGSLKAKAGEIFESATIYVQNRIERDLKLSVSLSMFALDRAVKDSGRALNAAKKKSIFLIPEKSSYEEKKPEPEISR